MLSSTVVGAFEGYEQCKEVVVQLRDEGISVQSISVIGCLPCTSCLGSLASDDHIFSGSKTGLASLDALAGWLTGASILSIPFIGSFVVAGPIKTAFQGFTDSACTITDALTSLRIPEYEAMVYEALLSEHKVLLAVKVVNAQERQWISKAMMHVQAIIVSPRLLSFGDSSIAACS